MPSDSSFVCRARFDSFRMERLCQEGGLFGHTEARCPMLRLLCDDVPTTEIFAAY